MSYRYNADDVRIRLKHFQGPPGDATAANEAAARADNAAAAAENAAAAANNAATKAGNAAQEIVSAADTAQAAAKTANTAAEAANRAASSANSATLNVNAAASGAETAAAQARSATESAITATNNANSAATAAVQATNGAQSAAQNAKDAANLTVQATGAAEEATQDALAAAGAANNAANRANTQADAAAANTQALKDVHPQAVAATEAANTAAANAQAATDDSKARTDEAVANAQAATQEAQTAADDATAAAETARSTIYTRAVAIPDTSALAASHELYAQKDHPLNVRVHGHTYQKGEGDPSPENVRPIHGLDAAQVNVGQGDYITTVDLPLLPDGAPLMEGDTVENWVKSGCDATITFDGSDDEEFTLVTGTAYQIWIPAYDHSGFVMFTNRMPVMTYGITSATQAESGKVGWQATADTIYINDPDCASVAALREKLAANPLKIYYRSTDYTPDKDLRVCRVVRRRKTDILIDRTWNLAGSNAAGLFVYYSYTGNPVSGEQAHSALCSVLPTINNYANPTPCFYTGESYGGRLWIVAPADITDSNGLKEWLTEAATATYELATPKIYYTDPLPLLPPAALESDTVTVTGSGETEVEYAHETKRYIDSSVALVSDNVRLLKDETANIINGESIPKYFSFIYGYTHTAPNNTPDNPAGAAGKTTCITPMYIPTNVGRIFVDSKTYKFCVVYYDAGKIWKAYDGFYALDSYNLTRQYAYAAIELRRIDGADVDLEEAKKGCWILEAVGAPKYVDGANGDDANAGTVESPYKTIQRAVDVGAKTIYVAPGDYTESVRIYGRDGVSIMPMPAEWAIYAETVPDTPMIHITGGDSSSIAAGITIEESSNIRIENVWTDYTSEAGFKITKTSGLVMQRCFASNAEIDGFMINNVNGVFRDCVAWNSKTRDGFNIHGYGSTVFTNCVAHDCADDGLSHHDGCTGAVYGGEFYNCGKAGVATPTYGAVIDMHDVICHNNTYGIYIVSTTERTKRTARIHGVLCYANDVGVEIVQTKVIAHRCSFVENAQNILQGDGAEFIQYFTG